MVHVPEKMANQQLSVKFVDRIPDVANQEAGIAYCNLNQAIAHARVMQDMKVCFALTAYNDHPDKEHCMELFNFLKFCDLMCAAEKPTPLKD
jgi:hypothetical protein